MFLGRPLAAHLEEYYADQLDLKDTLERRLKEEHMGPHDRVRILEAIRSIADIFAEGAGEETRTESDPLAAYWEQQIERGEEPNLDLTIEDLKEMGGL